jgi:hypothetical protein
MDVKIHGESFFALAFLELKYRSTRSSCLSWDFLGSNNGKKVSGGKGGE